MIDLRLSLTILLVRTGQYLGGRMAGDLFPYFLARLHKYSDMDFVSFLQNALPNRREDYQT